MPHILLVDDEPQNLAALRREIGRRHPNWVVGSAGNERRAIEYIGQHDVDVVVTDLVMTKPQGGIEVLESAKAKDPLAMVIVITAFEQNLDRYSAFSAGAFDCIQKNTPGVVAINEIIVKTESALNFRSLAVDQVKHERETGFLRRYFDPRVFDALLEDRSLLELNSRVVTIVFWDIRGFSRLSESLKGHPALIAGFLKDYFSDAARIIFENNGVLDKYIGDGVMGLFGALGENSETSRDTAATEAVNAALSLRAAFSGNVQKWTKEWKKSTAETIDIGLGCGIHTGEVLVGNVGTDIRDQFTALSPHVNLAARIEGKSGKGDILLSASTQVRVEKQFNFSKFGSVNDIKNIPGTFELFSVQ